MQMTRRKHRFEINHARLAEESEGMSMKTELPKDAQISEPKALDRYLEWDEIPQGERMLLIEDETVYAEDLVHLGLSWQDFHTLVVRVKS